MRAILSLKASKGTASSGDAYCVARAECDSYMLQTSDLAVDRSRGHRLSIENHRKLLVVQVPEPIVVVIATIELEADQVIFNVNQRLAAKGSACKRDVLCVLTGTQTESDLGIGAQ